MVGLVGDLVKLVIWQQHMQQFQLWLGLVTSQYLHVQVIVGTQEALDVIDRPKLYRFLLSRRSASGGFSMHDQGETDMRCEIS